MINIPYVVSTQTYSIKEDNQQAENQREQIKEYFEKVSAALANGQQLPGSIVAPKDQKFMSELLHLANDKKNGLNAHYCNSPLEMVEKIKELLKDNKHSSRFVVNMGEDGIHFSAFEFFKKNENISIIGIEPATTQGMGSSLLAFRALTAVKREFPDAAFAFVETDMQRSSGDCGIFSLFLVKKMFKEAPFMRSLHEKNISGELKTSCGILEKDIANKLIPPSFMKHTQSPSRLEAYLRDNDYARELSVNKKGETLKERQSRNIVTIENNEKNITYSNSIEIKRQKEIERLLNT